MLEGVKDIVLFSPEEGEQLQLDGLVIDIRDKVEWPRCEIPYTHNMHLPRVPCLHTGY